MVNGYNLLTEKHAVPRMFEIVKNLPVIQQEILFYLVLGLFNRQNKALEAVEPFCFETTSRFKWKALKNTSLCGIPGAEQLGLNHCQQIWKVHNEVEDIRLYDETQWEGFKLTASAQSPKGVKKIDQRDRERAQTETALRQSIRDKFYYVQLGILKREDTKVSDGNPYVPGPKSVVDLEDEMYRWVAGKEDWHDSVVSGYKNRIVTKYELEREEKEERARLFRERLLVQDENGKNTVQPLVAYTSEQLSEILKDRGPGPAGTRFISGGDAVQRDYLYEKYLERAPDPGKLKPGEDGSLSADGAGGNVGLQDQVANRQVLFTTKSEEKE